MMADCRVYVGTCSWADRSLIECGEFYPRELAGNADKRLRYYASHFPTVEVDSSFYAIPDQKTVRAWAERVPEGFVMHLKAFAALTGHALRSEALPADIREVVRRQNAFETAPGDRMLLKDPAILRDLAARFVAMTEPLVRASRLGFLLFQFSPRFDYSPKRLEFLGTLVEWMSPCRLMFEFRHASWTQTDTWERTLARISELGHGVVTADEPQVGTPLTIPFLPRICSGVGYLRLHGRNANNWFRKDIATSQRYEYSYSEAELREFIDAVREMRREATKIFVMFNNCHEAAGIKNALLMQEMLETCTPGLVQHSMGKVETDPRPRQGRLTDHEERDEHGH